MYKRFGCSVQNVAFHLYCILVLLEKQDLNHIANTVHHVQVEHRKELKNTHAFKALEEIGHIVRE